MLLVVMYLKFVPPELIMHISLGKFPVANTILSPEGDHDGRHAVAV